MEDSDISSSLETIMEERNMTRKEIDEHVTYIYSSDTKYGIIYILDLYDMLNLKAIAKFLGKSQSTIHKHLEDLMERGYIRIANTMKGKFYEIAELIRVIRACQEEEFNSRNFDQELEEFRKMDDMEFIDYALDKFDLEKVEQGKVKGEIGSTVLFKIEELLTNAAATISVINQISIASTSDLYLHLYLIYLLRTLKEDRMTALDNEIDRLAAQGNFDDRIKDYLKRKQMDYQEMSKSDYKDLIIDGLAEKKYRVILEKYYDGTVTMDEIRRVFPIGSVDIADYKLKMSNIDQVSRLSSLLIEFHQNIRQLDKEFKEENRDVDPEILTTQIINIFSGTLPKD